MPIWNYRVLIAHPGGGKARTSTSWTADLAFGILGDIGVISGEKRMQTTTMGLYRV